MASRCPNPCRLLPLLSAVLFACSQAGYAEDGDGAGVALAASAEGLAQSAAVALYLDVTVNGRAAGLAEVDMRGGKLWIARGALSQLGLVVAPDLPDTVAIDDMKDVKVEYAVADQRLILTVPVAMLNQPVSRLAMTEAGEPAAQATPGLVVNYSLFGAVNDGAMSLNGYTELRAFNAHGVIESTFAERLEETDEGWTGDAVRLDSSLTMSFPSSMLNVRAGDGFTSAGAWSRTTRFGGVQVGTNFALQPYLVTTPLPQFAGEATLPSTVELYVEGLKQLTGDVPPGPFQLTGPTGSITGLTQGQVVLSDITGRVSTFNFSFYQTPQLLRPGLTDWSVEAGAIRENYGYSSFDYGGELFASGTMRRGLSDQVTLEAHGEASGRLGQAGAGVTWLLPANLGVATGSLAASKSDGRSGAQLAASYNWSDRRSSVSFNLTAATKGYRDLASLDGGTLPTWQMSAQVSRSSRRFGTFNLSYVDLKVPEEPRAQFVSANWFKSIGERIGVGFTATQDLVRTERRSVFATLNVRFGGRTSMSGTVNADQDATSFALEARRSVPYEGGLGWRAQAYERSGRVSAAGEVEYLGDKGRAVAGANVNGGRFGGYAGFTGSLAVLDGSVFAGREIHDSFAVVSTGGVADVPVQLQNNLVGTTNGDGKLLVTGLNAYQANLVTIDPTNLPADVQVARIDALVTPTDRAGTTVQFALKRVRAATLVLVDQTGAPLPLGSVAILDGRTDRPAFVGYDGEAYFDALSDSNGIEVRTAAGTCAVRFDLPASSTVPPRIGPLTCIPTEQPV